MKRSDFLRGVLAGLVVPGLAGSALAQVVPGSAGAPVQVTNGKGEFAQKLQGKLMPIGKGWKAVADHERLLQVMVPEGWKTEVPAMGGTVLRAHPPGSGKESGAVLEVTLLNPADEDPLEITEELAADIAEGLTEQPELQRRKFRLTDSGFVRARGMRFALAGGTLDAGKKGTYRQQQLVYITEERIVTLQFTAPDKEFARYADDVAGIFASYSTLGVRKEVED